MLDSACQKAKKASPTLQLSNDLFKNVVDTGLYGAAFALSVLPPTAVSSEPFIFATNKDELMFEDMPKTLSALIDIEGIKNEGYSGRIGKDNTYKLFKEGIPELGLKGETLATLYI